MSPTSLTVVNEAQNPLDTDWRTRSTSPKLRPRPTGLHLVVVNTLKMAKGAREDADGSLPEPNRLLA